MEVLHDAPQGMKPIGSPDVVETVLAEDDDVRFFSDVIL